MKKLLYSILAFGLLATVSCTDDDDKGPEPMPVNAVSYKGTSYTIDNGAIIDWGSWDNHYNYDFFLTDGDLDLENESADNASVLIYAELWSPGTDNFTTGTFTFDDSDDRDGKKYFDNTVVVLDTNKNGELDENDDQLTANAGTIKVSGTGSSYTVEVNITLSNNQPLKGKYSGTFEMYEGELEEMPGGRYRAAKPSHFSFK